MFPPQLDVPYAVSKHAVMGLTETLAREHSRLARTNLEMALKQHNLTRIPGASLVKFPEAI